ncbi:hypothetical protein GSI_08329 [Ganoderma sinense ZZ0214-1]|uniref:NmrA-like domain-containing protein n=1 Tax=Ganoderma sinense ZZ0214-1 TaxID=1077348 RepID=A0A2G8S6Y9_9APHY|nr:hypothetical protein GSI_08329 [Ganoderma sinense ZZ0214-1]
MTTEKLPLVLIVGGTGWTVTSILQGLLKSGNFRISALVRPASVPKPSTQSLKAQGVEIRVGDLTDRVAKLTAALTGVTADLFTAAKAVGTVTRVVPCDFASAGAPGVRALRDMVRPPSPFSQSSPSHPHLPSRSRTRSRTLNHTERALILILRNSPSARTSSPSGSATPSSTSTSAGGCSSSIYLPPPPLPESAASAGAGALKMSRHVYIHTLLTNLDHVGTCGRTRLERAQLDAREIGERVSGDGDGDALRALRVPMTREELERWRDEGRAAVARDPGTADGAAQMKQGMSEYMLHLHLHFLQESTLANVTRLRLEEPGAYYMRIKLP